MFNSLIVDLLPADQLFVQNIKGRYLELADEKEPIALAVRKAQSTPMPTAKTAPVPVEKKIKEQQIKETKAPVKKAPVPRLLPKKTPPAKKVMTKKKITTPTKRIAPKKQLPVSRPLEEKKVQVIETRIPMETNIREEL
jgi:hypothetical protein